MNVDIITLHRAESYGSVLQTFALQKKIEELGHAARILDYHPERYTNRGKLKRLKNQSKKFRNPLLLLIAKMLIYPSYLKKKIENKKDLKEWINADFATYQMEHPFFARITYGENWELFSYVKNLRYLEYYSNRSGMLSKIFRFYHWLLHRKNIKKTGIHIAPNCVGPGLHLVHRGFRRLGEKSYMKIGTNCTCLPMVLFGKKLQMFPRKTLKLVTTVILVLVQQFWARLK